MEMAGTRSKPSHDTTTTTPWIKRGLNRKKKPKQSQHPNLAQRTSISRSVARLAGSQQVNHDQQRGRSLEISGEVRGGPCLLSSPDTTRDLCGGAPLCSPSPCSRRPLLVSLGVHSALHPPTTQLSLVAAEAPTSLLLQQRALVSFCWREGNLARSLHPSSPSKRSPLRLLGLVVVLLACRRQSTHRERPIRTPPCK